MNFINYQNQMDWSIEHGNSQSPIELGNEFVINKNILEKIENYKINSMKNNGNNLSLSASGEVSVEGRNYVLNEVHFHHSAEHKFKQESKLRSLEVHLVHQNALKQLLVMSSTFNVGAPNAIIEKIFQDMENNFVINHPFEIGDLIPNYGNYYRYIGSLTTPPLSEGVEWIIFEEPLTISANQLARYLQYFPTLNNRKIQKNNGRVIQKYLRK